MPVSHVILSCTDQDNVDWRGVVDKWSEIRPDWQHRADYDDQSNEFEKYCYNIIIKNKKDMLDVFKLILDLNTVYSDLRIEWINKIEGASISICDDYSTFVRGHINHREIESSIINDLRKVKDILKNY